MSVILNLIHAAKMRIGALVCHFKGCSYQAPFFYSNCLYFCDRCGKEMLNRGWDDIEPMTDEDRETLEYFDAHYEEHA